MILLVLFSLIASSLRAEPVPESTSVSSTSADYDGNALILRGQVLLDHGLGKMSAEEASLEKQEAGKDFPFSTIHLKKEVLLTLKNEAELRCDTADLDFTALKGLLLSKDKGKVVYTDSLKGKEGEKGLLRMMSNAVELELAKLGYDGKKTDYGIDKILAIEEVIIDYASNFTLRADRAVFRKLQNESSGIVTAYPKDQNSHCRLTHEGDVIDADTVDLDLVHSRIMMTAPRGYLISSLVPQLQKGEIRFRSDQLIWDHLQNNLCLKGHVHVDESPLGTIATDDQLEIAHSRQKGKRVLKSIHSTGKTTLDYKNPTDQTDHKLISYGVVFIDREHLNASIDSPEIDGSVPPEKQIYYEEQNLSIYSDKAAFEYSIVESSLQPVSMALKGNVRLFSRDLAKPRCALADRLNYSPSTRTLILASNPGSKVLFWDEEQQLRISANEIHITQDPGSKKETIKGVGNVQFAFSSEESSMLKQIFSTYQTPHE